MSITEQALTFLVYLLTDLSAHGDIIPEGTVIEVDRSVRNDWVGSRLCRDATAEEIAEYRAEHGAADLIVEDIRELARDRGDLEDDIATLNGQKDALSGELEELEGQKTTLTNEITALEGKKTALTGDVAALEARKAAAEKPATTAKPK